MRDVFILGAGFSKALSKEMPITSDLWNDIAADPEYPDLLKVDLWEKDLEMVLTYLSQVHPWLPEKEILRNRAAFLDLSSAIQKHLSMRLRKAVEDIANHDSGWIHKLFWNWRSTRAQIITLNYDTLIEILCSDSTSGDQRVQTKTCDLYPVEMKTLVMDGGSHTRSSTFTLFKLHGSINWFYSGHENSSAEDIYAAVYDGGLKGYFENKLQWQYQELRHKVPLLIPPVLDKGTYFRNTSLRATWEDALAAIREADRIFCLGYSLPKSDITMRFFLQGESKRNIPFYLVNLDGGSGEHFKAMLPGYSHQPPLFGEHCVQDFVEKYCGGGLTSPLG
jgi:hypothetical protein